jgi:hypothetical protein
MRGGQSAARQVRSNGSISTVGSFSGTPPPGTGKRSCNASPKPAVRGRPCPSPRAFVLWEARDRSTWPAPPCCCRVRRVLHAILRPRPLGPPMVARLVGRDWARCSGDAPPRLGPALTQYDERGWRATFYTTGMEHSPTGAIGTTWERTPVACDAAGGVEGAQTDRREGRPMMRLVD